jgi:broad specificity phosphatase PhoE
LGDAINRLRGIQQAEVADERLARLRNRKAAVSSQLDERRAAARFEPVVEESAGPARDADQILSEASAGPSTAAPPPTSAKSTSQGPKTEEETYTERLLAAKKKAKQNP